MRAFVACGWFGIQTWIGGAALFAAIGALLKTLTGDGSGWTQAPTISLGIGVAAAQPWTMWLCFAIFWALNILIVVWGMEAIKKFENWAAPFLIVVFLVLMVWMIPRAGGLGPVVEERWHRRLGVGLLGEALPDRADGHDRVLVHPVAEHARLHPVRPQPA